MLRPFRSWFRTSPASNPSKGHRSSISRQLGIESLEDRLTPSSYMVDSAADIDDNVVTANELSLREAIRLANADAAPDTIYFSPILSGNTLTLTGPTYAIATPMTITAVFGNTQATSLVIDGGNAATIFQIDDGNAGSRIDVVINGLTLTHGATAGAGGAIRVGADNLSLYNSTIANSAASIGGAIAVQSGKLVVANSTLFGNFAGALGGAIALSGATATVFNSTFSGNSAGSSAGPSGQGGGLQIQDNSSATFTNCTFANNFINLGAGEGAGGGINIAAGSGLSLVNTIVAGNGIGEGGVQSDIAGQVAVDSVNNIVGNASSSGGLKDGVSGNIVGNSGAGILSLASIIYPRIFGNGGPTATFALVPNSPAINAGVSARAIDNTNAALTVDQRGPTYNRVVGTSVDIGAVELQTNEAATFFRTAVGPAPSGSGTVSSATALAPFSGAANNAPDLAVADAANNTVSIFLANGAGGFSATPATVLTLPDGANPGAITVVDFNGDFRPDIAVANSGLSGNASVSVFLNTTTVPGTPAFSTRIDLNGPNNPIALAAANIDGDAFNRIDLAVLSSTVNSSGNYTLTVFLNIGLGGFNGGTSIKLGDDTPDFSEIVSPSSFAVGDLVGDGKPEIMVTGSNGATYLTNVSTTGGPAFTLAGSRFSSSNNTGAAIGKIDGDNLNDMLYLTPIAGGNVVIFRNNGGGSFNGAGFLVNADPVAVRIADVNADGKNDLLIAHGTPGTISLMVNTTTTSTISLASAVNVHLGGAPSGFAVGDIDLNGIPDLAVANGGAGTDLLLGNAGFAAHSYVVDSLADTSDNIYSAGNLTLREAIALANINPGRDTISFADTLTAGGAATINLASDLPTITDDLTIAGPGSNLLTLNGQSARRILNIDDGNNADDIAVAIAGFTFKNGKADGGGAIRSLENLTVSQSDFLNNQSGNTLSGGAIASVDAGTLTIFDSSFTSNSANSSSGGAVYTNRPTTIFGASFKGNSAANGGAIFADGITTSISNSTFSSNAATPASGLGGAIRVATGTLTLTNSTISGNTANNGGGISLAANTNATITNATITGNTAASGAGLAAVGSAALYNSIVAGNTISGGSTPNDVAGALAAASANNLIGNAATSGGLSNGVNNNFVGNNGTGTRPIATILNPTLANNGSALLTHALVQNSLAIGAASESAPGFVRYDEREAARDNGAPDIGAFESQHPLSPVGVPSDDARTFTPLPSPDANTAFIKGLYHATLLRNAEQSGLKYWVDRLNAGTSREEVALGFINSFENRSNQVTFFYRYFLHREADASGLNYHVGRLQSGIDEATVMSGFILSPEFTGQNDNTSFVNLMYYALLGRQAEPNGFAFWKSALDSGLSSRNQVAASFLRSQEGITRIVDSYFLSYLKRPADSSGGAFFVGLIGSGQTFGAVAAKILASNDFYFNHGMVKQS